MSHSRIVLTGRDRAPVRHQTSPNSVVEEGWHVMAKSPRTKSDRSQPAGGETHRTAENRDFAVLTINERNGVTGAVKKAEGKVVIVAPAVRGAKLSDGSIRKADGQLAGSLSHIFDAVAIMLSEDGCAARLKDAAAVQFAMDAFGHLKANGRSETAKPLLDKAGIEPDKGVTGLGKPFVAAASRRFYDREPNLRTLA